jgi:hypothetical protein
MKIFVYRAENTANYIYNLFITIRAMITQWPTVEIFIIFTLVMLKMCTLTAIIHSDGTHLIQI